MSTKLPVLAFFLVSLSLVGGCDETEKCAMSDASLPGLEVIMTMGPDETVVGILGELSASANNDCPGSSDQVSVTIESVEFTGGNLTLCVPDTRDDGERLITEHPADAPETRIELVTLIAYAGQGLAGEPCTVTATGDAPVGNATLQTQCDTDDLILTIDMTVPATLTCAEEPDQEATLAVSGAILANTL